MYCSCVALAAHIPIAQTFIATNYITIAPSRRHHHHPRHNFRHYHYHHYGQPLPQRGYDCSPTMFFNSNYCDSNRTPRAAPAAALRTWHSIKHRRRPEALEAQNVAGVGEVRRALSASQERLEMNRGILNEPKLRGELEYLEGLSAEEGFWNEAVSARKVLGDMNRCVDVYPPWFLLPCHVCAGCVFCASIVIVSVLATDFRAGMAVSTEQHPPYVKSLEGVLCKITAKRCVVMPWVALFLLSTIALM